MDIGIGGLPGTVCEYKMALGAERKIDKDAKEDFAFFGVIGIAGASFSVKTGGSGLCKAIGGGAAESKDEARVNAGLAKHFNRSALSEPSWRTAGSVLWSHQGIASKSRVEGKDSRSASSYAKGRDGASEALRSASRSAFSSPGPFDGMDNVLERVEKPVDVRCGDV